MNIRKGSDVMENIKLIDNYINSLNFSKALLISAKKDYLDLKNELLQFGCFVSRLNCTYTIEDINYAIKLINLKLNILKIKN